MSNYRLPATPSARAAATAAAAAARRVGFPVHTVDVDGGDIWRPRGSELDSS